MMDDGKPSSSWRGDTTLDLKVPVGGTVTRLTVAEDWDKTVKKETELKKTDFGDPGRPELFQLAWTCPFCGRFNETGCAARAITGEYEEMCGECYARVVKYRCPICGYRMDWWEDECVHCMEEKK